MVEADVVCVPCGEGTYSPLGIYCLTCLAGSYTADQINCNPCDAGTFSATDGATSCTACPPGWHQPASGQLECERCEPGRVASVSGQASCDRCDAGTYSAAAGASTCVDCAPGRIQSESGRSECEQCAAGRFASSATACSSCLQFGAGRTSPPGAAVCDICEADYYYDGQSCLDCPWSATCARNSTLGSQWIVDEGFYRFSMDTPEIYRCKRNDGCVGGAGSGDDLCANHHHGPLCHLCDRGYYMEPVLRTCQRCDQRPSTFLMVAFFFFVLIVLFVFAVLIWSCVWGSGYTKELLQALKSSHLRRWVQTHFGDFFRSDCARAIWYSWTVLVRFSSVEDVKYPGPFAWVMRIYGLVTLDLVAWLPTPCIRWSYYDTLLAATLLPVAYVVVAWLYNLGRRHLKEKSAEPMTPEQKAEQKDEKIEQLRHLIESNIGTAKHYSNEGWPPWLLEAENCIDTLLDELGADRKNTEISRARQIIADYAIKKKGKKSMEMPPGALRSFVEFAGREELKGDYYFANRAQRLHARKSSNATRARLEAECRFLQSRVHEAIEKELADDPERVKERLEAVSKQATDFFSKIYMSIYDTALESAGKQATDAYDKAIEKLKAGAPGQCHQRSASAPALLVDALGVAPQFNNFVGRLVDAAVDDGHDVERKRPPPKGAARIVEKCALKPDAPHDTSRVCDVNRDMIVCDTLGDLTDLLRRLAQSKEVSVVRVKDRHNRPPPSMWRDVMVNILLTGDDTRHVCELQLCLAMMLTGREGLHGHTLYNRQRCADELLEKLRG